MIYKWNKFFELHNIIYKYYDAKKLNQNYSQLIQSSIDQRYSTICWFDWFLSTFYSQFQSCCNFVHFDVKKFRKNIQKNKNRKRKRNWNWNWNWNRNRNRNFQRFKKKLFLKSLRHLKSWKFILSKCRCYIILIFFVKFEWKAMFSTKS